MEVMGHPLDGSASTGAGGAEVVLIGAVVLVLVALVAGILLWRRRRHANG